MGATLSCALVALPAAAVPVSWIGGNGNWNVAANWSSNPALPGPTDDVSNATGFTITHGTGADVIHSFVSTGPFVLSGGSLSGSDPTLSTFQVNNTFNLSGGTLRDFLVLPGVGAPAIIVNNSSNNFLDNVRVNIAPLDMSAAGVIRVVNGLTLNSTATINGNGVLAFQGTQTLAGDATLVFGATGNNRLAIDGNAVLTLGRMCSCAGRMPTSARASSSAAPGN